MKLYIGTDHRGYKLKEKLLGWLKQTGYNPVDMGASKYDPQDDYTLYAEKVASLVADNPGSKGILLCGSGVGVDVVANKYDGIRASIGKTPEQVEAGRRDDNMNILVLAADYTTLRDAKKMVSKFIETDFDGLERHKRRLEDIRRIEQNN